MQNTYSLSCVWNLMCSHTRKLVGFERWHNLIAASCVLNQPHTMAKFARRVCLHICLHFREMPTSIHHFCTFLNDVGGLRSFVEGQYKTEFLRPTVATLQRPSSALDKWADEWSNFQSGSPTSPEFHMCCANCHFSIFIQYMVVSSRSSAKKPSSSHCKAKTLERKKLTLHTWWCSLW